MRVVSANLQHGVPDPVGRPALDRAVRAAARRWPPTCRRSRSSTTGAGARGSPTRARSWPTALGRRAGVGAGQARALGRSGQRARRARRGGRARGRRAAGRGRAAGARCSRSWRCAASAGRSARPTSSLEPGGRPRASCGRRSHLLITRPGPVGAGRRPQPRAGRRRRRSPSEHGFDLARRPAHALRAPHAEPPPRPRPHRRLPRSTASGVAKLPVSDHLAVWADLSPP